MKLLLTVIIILAIDGSSANGDVSHSRAAASEQSVLIESVEVFALKCDDQKNCQVGISLLLTEFGEKTLVDNNPMDWFNGPPTLFRSRTPCHAIVHLQKSRVFRLMANGILAEASLNSEIMEMMDDLNQQVRNECEYYGNHVFKDYYMFDKSIKNKIRPPRFNRFLEEPHPTGKKSETE